MTRFVVRDKRPAFSEVVGLVSHSIIAIAVGTYLDGSPQIVGTGFAIEYAEFFSTCWHVANVHDELSHLTDAQLRERSLKDAKLRIAIPTSGKYLWQELPK